MKYMRGFFGFPLSVRMKMKTAITVGSYLSENLHLMVAYENPISHLQFSSHQYCYHLF